MKANLDYKYENGTTNLIRAVKNGHMQSIKYLLSQGVDTSAQSHYYQMNAAHYTIERWYSASGKKLAGIISALCSHDKTDLTNVDNMGHVFCVPVEIQATKIESPGTQAEAFISRYRKSSGRHELANWTEVQAAV